MKNDSRNANARLRDKRVAIVATHGFEQDELTQPLKALRDAGATVDVIAPENGQIQGFRHFEKGDKVDVTRTLAEANPADYDALVLPGGLFNPDKLRMDEHALKFASAIAKAGKPLAAICHGPWILINAGLVKGRKLTSVASIRKDLENAGARWVDEEVIVDNGLVTSRTPKDLPAFNAKLIEEIAEGQHRGQAERARSAA